MIDRLEKELERSKQEQEERKARRKRNVYNSRFANKNCWNCGERGHLIYWCPELHD